MKESLKESAIADQQANFATTTDNSFSEDMFHHLVAQNILTVPKQYCDTAEKLEKKKNIVTAMLRDINPNDVTEGMLAAQMIAVNNMAMHCLTMANDMGVCSMHIQNWMNQGNKLIRTYTMLLDSLMRYRNKDVLPSLTVERVDVHSGGQAIVGNVNGNI